MASTIGFFAQFGTRYGSRGADVWQDESFFRLQVATPKRLRRTCFYCDFLWHRLLQHLNRFSGVPSLGKYIG